MGVLAEACEDNATVIYEMDKREEFDVQEYIRSMGGYNKRYRSSMCTLRGWTMVVVGVHCSLMCFDLSPLSSSARVGGCLARSTPREKPCRRDLVQERLPGPARAAQGQRPGEGHGRATRLHRGQRLRREDKHQPVFPWPRWRQARRGGGAVPRGKCRYRRRDRCRGSLRYRRRQTTTRARAESGKWLERGQRCSCGGNR